MTQRCAWHGDAGWCPRPRAFPATTTVPPFCSAHLAALEPWITSRASRPADARAWIGWAARRARASDAMLRAVMGLRPGR